MAKRKIIKIDENKCNGCSLCIPNCAEGALQIIDGKARLISDLFCDGLGACIGHCPEGAITIEEREAGVYDEKLVMEENIIPAGKNTIIEHLKHMSDHNEIEYYNEAIDILKEKGLYDEIIAELNKNTEPIAPTQGGCPGSRMMSFDEKDSDSLTESGTRESELRQWPVQFHLLSPTAPYFRGADVLFAADCVAYTVADFHRDYLKGKSLVIACPKLDSGLDSYLEKLQTMIDVAKINSLTIMVMEVPCCSGLVRLVEQALQNSSRKVPVKVILIGVKGDILSDEWT